MFVVVIIFVDEDFFKEDVCENELLLNVDNLGNILSMWKDNKFKKKIFFNKVLILNWCD